MFAWAVPAESLTSAAACSLSLDVLGRFLARAVTDWAASLAASLRCFTDSSAADWTVSTGGWA